MGFWFECSRTPWTPEVEWTHGGGTVDDGMRPEDLELYKNHEVDMWANGSWCNDEKTEDGRFGWGTKSDAYWLSDQLGASFDKYINEWAPPKVVREWGLALQNSSILLFGPPDDYDYYSYRYGKWLEALGDAGIGLLLSW